MTGYLTRAFFEQELDRLIEGYRKEVGEKRVEVQVMLRDGQALSLEGKPACTDTYVLCDYKARGRKVRAAVPYGSIIAVSLVADGGGTMGFGR